jgi:type I phosphodiesterase/nucleotide pyrophosphatase
MLQVYTRKLGPLRLADGSAATVSWWLLCAAVPAAVTAIQLLVLNGPFAWSETAALAIQLYALFAIVFAGPFAALWIAGLVRGRRPVAREMFACAAVSVFALFWYERLKPFELWTRRALVTPTSAVTIVALGAAAILVAAATARPARSRAWYALRSIAAIVCASLILAAFARIAEPGRDRSAAIRTIAPNPSASASVAPGSQRVLFVGIDGLDWNVLADLVRRDQLPAFKALITRGRSFQLDSRELSLSPGIWTAIYTGQLDNPIATYDEWWFRGVSQPIARLPEAGRHPAWGLDESLRATRDLGLWHDEPVTGARMMHAPFWRFASAAGQRVAVFWPTPFPPLAEEVNGVFVREEDTNDVAYWRAADGRTSQARYPIPPSNTSPVTSALLDAERRRQEIVADVLRREPFQLAVYYTAVLDDVSHDSWPAYGTRDSVIDEAYRRVDRDVARVREEFGGPAAVVIASDHGWEYNPYQHSRVPYGVLIVSGDAVTTGFGGTADLRSVAPAVLALLKAPAAQQMTRSLDGCPEPGVLLDEAEARAVFVRTGQATMSSAARDRLRAIGYVSR